MINLKRETSHVYLLMIKFLKTFHHKTQSQQRMNTTMMSAFDVVDLCRRNGGIRQGRKGQDHREKEHFQEVMIILKQ